MDHTEDVNISSWDIDVTPTTGTYRERHYVYILPFILLVITTCLLNAAVMATVRSNRKLMTVVNVYVFSLAVADSVVGSITTLGLMVHTVYGYWPLDEVVCGIWVMLDFSSTTVSMYHMCLIAIDRYLTSISTTRNRLLVISKRRATYRAVAAWVICFIIWIPVTIYIELTVGLFDSNHNCWFVPSFPLVMANSIMFYYIPLGVIGYCYVNIIYALHVNRRKDQRSGTYANGIAMSAYGTSLPHRTETMKVPGIDVSAEVRIESNNLRSPDEFTSDGSETLTGQLSTASSNDTQEILKISNAEANDESPAMIQVSPMPGPGSENNHIQTLDVHHREVVPLRAIPSHDMDSAAGSIGVYPEDVGSDQCKVISMANTADCERIMKIPIFPEACGAGTEKAESCHGSARPNMNEDDRELPGENSVESAKRIESSTSFKISTGTIGPVQLKNLSDFSVSNNMSSLPGILDGDSLPKDGDGLQNLHIHQEESKCIVQKPHTIEGSDHIPVGLENSKSNIRQQPKPSTNHSSKTETCRNESPQETLKGEQYINPPQDVTKPRTTDRHLPVTDSTSGSPPNSQVSGRVTSQWQALSKSIRDCFSRLMSPNQVFPVGRKRAGTDTKSIISQHLSLESDNKMEKRRKSMQRRATTALSFAMIAYIICWLPFCVIWPIESRCHCVPKPVFFSSYVLTYLNSTINPLLYFIFNSDFRQGFLHMMRSHLGLRRPQSEELE